MIYDDVFAKFGMEVFTNEHIQSLRERNMILADKKEQSFDIIPQEGFQENVLINPADIKIIGGKRGAGKAEPYDADVLTPFGFRKMGDLEVGSIITNPDNTQQRVIQIHEQGIKDVYRLKFIDGASVECDLDHLWLLRKTCDVSKVARKRKEIYGEDYWNGKVWTTKMIIDFLDKKDSSDAPHIKNQNLLVPLCNEISFASGRRKELTIHPYVLGALLGDGCLSGWYISMTSADKELIHNIESFGYPMRKYKAEYTYGFFEAKKIKEEIEELGLLNKLSYDKFVPEQYKYASIEDRKLLIQGLFDTDGYIDEKGNVEFVTVSKQLALDVQWIIRSLGGKATINTKIPEYSHNGEKKEGALAYRLYINTPKNSDLVRLSRKKERIIDEFNGGVSTLSNRIVGYEYVGKKQCRCITVDHPNSLYVTNDFVVTHNSFVMLLSPKYYDDNPNYVCHGFRREEDDIKRGLWKECKIIYHGEATFTEGDFTAKFPSGSRITFEHLANEAEVDRRFRGVEIPEMMIDELPQISFKTFFTLLASNRNSLGIRNRFVASCNPVSKRNWVYKFIRWWIDEETNEIIKERSGKVRYFFKHGSDIGEIAWGDTKEEVYEKAKQHIDAIYDDALSSTGGSKYDLISSLSFIEGEYSENKIFRTKDPMYLGRLAQQGGRQSFKDIKGIWGDDDEGEVLLTYDEMSRYLYNTEQRSGILYAVIDVALSRDGFTIGIFDGNHLLDYKQFTQVGSITAATIAKNYIALYGVREENVMFDADGIGQYLEEYMPKAFKFNNNSASSDSRVYTNYKAECADKWVRRVKEGMASVNQQLLTRKIGVRTFEEELQHQRSALVQKNTTNGKFQLISKAEMKILLGNKQSPDFIDMLFMKEHFNLTKNKSWNNTWILG